MRQGLSLGVVLNRMTLSTAARKQYADESNSFFISRNWPVLVMVDV